jgi:hypothetical protein
MPADESESRHHEAGGKHFQTLALSELSMGCEEHLSPTLGLACTLLKPCMIFRRDSHHNMVYHKQDTLAPRFAMAASKLWSNRVSFCFLTPHLFLAQLTAALPNMQNLAKS